MSCISDYKIHNKLAQFYEVLDNQKYDENVAKRMLASLADKLNYKISDKTFFPSQNTDSVPTGSTALHLALHKNNKVIFDYLLDLGADFTVKDDNGSTVLHKVIYMISRENNNLDLSIDFLHVIVNAHLKYKNTTNPCDKNGLSHFHAACIINNTKAVECFVNNGVSVNDAVNSNSPIFPGYTPLHFAIFFRSVDVTKLLVNCGANRQLKNTEGLTPLQMAIKKTVELHDQINMGEQEFYNNTLIEVEVEMILKILIDSNINDMIKDDDDGLTSFHAACTLNDTRIAAKLEDIFKDPNHSVNMNSPVCPGYTAAHFAARCNFYLVKYLVDRGARMELKDANGLTPFQLCLDRYLACDIYLIMLNYPTWKNILLSDGETKLVDLVKAMKPDKIDLFLKKNGKLFVPVDSPLWPGYSVLHLAVIFTERSKDKTNYRGMTALKFKPNLELITKCLKENVDVTLQDVHGMTPVHLAFRLGRKQVLKLLLDAHHKKVNPVDRDNLSHLHIACAAKNNNLARDLIANGADVNLPINVAFQWNLNMTQMDFNVSISSKSTPLHIAVVVENCELIKCLLKNQADLYAKNAEDHTPLHLLLNTRKPIDKILASAIMKTVDVRECVAKDGWTHLHVASAADNSRVIKALCERGLDVNATIKEGPLTGYTPLQLAIERGNSFVLSYLIDFGADLLAKKPNGMTPFYEILSRDSHISIPQKIRDLFVKSLHEHTNKDIGLTRLHYECVICDWQAVIEILENGNENVNARLTDDSPIWPGATPLHVLMRKARKDNHYTLDDVYILICLLVDFGADVTIKDVEGSTPLHMAFNAVWSDRDQLENNPVRFQCQLLLKAHKDVTNNPVDHNGLSHFHVACFFHEVTLAKEFLKKGVDVNTSVKDHCSTPLHLALIHHSPNQLIMIDLLLSYGADVQAEDKHGDTPLHLAMKLSVSHRELLFNKLVERGADVMAMNSLSKTPFEILLKSADALPMEVKMFLKDKRCRVNSYNPHTGEGYITLIFLILYPNPSCLKTSFLDCIDITDVDEFGRTYLHNAVSIGTPKSFQCYAYLLVKLLQCRVDRRDNLGRTALHLAVRFRNYDAVNNLLLAGADINEEDREGKLPLSYGLEPLSQFEQQTEEDRKRTLKILYKHVQKMLICRLYVSSFNKSKAETIAVTGLMDISNELQRMKRMEIGSSHEITLLDMMSETKVVMTYPTMWIYNRNAIQNFFQKFGRICQYQETKPLLVFQYKKALKMRRWFEDATESLRILIGIPLPYVCANIIFKCLIYWDVRNLIIAAKGESGLLT